MIMVVCYERWILWNGAGLCRCAVRVLVKEIRWWYVGLCQNITRNTGSSGSGQEEKYFVALGMRK